MANLKLLSSTEPVPVENDGKLIISLGKSRYETKWKNTTILWSKLLEKLGHSLETQETHTEYMKMGKDKQDRIKDIGGFVGGHLREGHRRSGYVEARQIVTLDLDYPPEDFWGKMMALVDSFDLDCAFAAYSTHKHTDKKPRYRLIIPLDRTVSPDEYEAIARKIGEKVGIDYFDDTTFQPSRLMFWPSHSSDVKPFFDYHDEVFLSADGILNEYTDWTDTSYWPMSSRVDEIRKREAKKAGDPLEKPGVIGAFNQTYTISAAISAFLSDVYTPTAKEDRYTYMAGSTAAGLVIYEDDLFAYSNHSTDPAGGKLCNAFDLVRIHFFGDLDKEAAPDTTITKLPSYREMVEMARKDPDVKKHLFEINEAKARESFGPLEEGEDWHTRLTVKKNGAIEPTLSNLRIIVENDEELKGIVFNELADGLEVKGGVPWKHQGKFWRDADDAQMICYIDSKYGTFSKVNYETAVTKVADDRSYHPVKEMFKSLPEWDGVPRVDTLLIDYLGAEDNGYTRAVIRKLLCAAYVRVHNRGAKFDYMIVLNGDQGIGKSAFISKLGGDWYSDSLAISDMNDKTAAEKLQGYWIMEIGELAGLRKADIDKVKAFISRQDDKYRATFGRRVTPHPRQCVFFGTTNNKDGYLRDITGNRRYWNVRVSGGVKKPWDIDKDTVDQIWAEVKVLAKAGEKLYLPPDLEEYARQEQRRAMEHDDRTGLVIKYLDTLLPENWEDMTLDERLIYLDDVEEGRAEKGTVRRKTVSNIEIWTECFRKRMDDFEPRKGYPISAIMASLEEWERLDRRKHIPIYGLQRLFRRSDEYDF